MKITKVTPWLIKAPRPFLDTADDSKNANRFKEYVFVEVSTDEGITGWGEITGTSAVSNRTVCAGLRHVSELIEGDDPRLIEMIWNKIFRAFTYMGSRGASTNIISAIDIALWDIRGKVLGLPDLRVVWRPGARRDPDLLPPTERIINKRHRPARESDRGYRSKSAETRSLAAEARRGIEWLLERQAQCRS